jgi:hypothetical protein
MGMVKCPKHGNHGGPHCCKHLLDAVYADNGRLVHGTVTIDLGDEESGDIEPFPHRLCLACLVEYGLQDGQVLPVKLWEADLFPWTCPVCQHCFADHEARLHGR